MSQPGPDSEVVQVQKDGEKCGKMEVSVPTGTHGVLGGIQQGQVPDMEGVTKLSTHSPGKGESGMVLPNISPCVSPIVTPNVIPSFPSVTNLCVVSLRKLDGLPAAVMENQRGSGGRREEDGRVEGSGEVRKGVVEDRGGESDCSPGDDTPGSPSTSCPKLSECRFRGNALSHHLVLGTVDYNTVSEALKQGDRTIA